MPADRDPAEPVPPWLRLDARDRWQARLALARGHVRAYAVGERERVSRKIETMRSLGIDAIPKCLADRALLESAPLSLAAYRSQLQQRVDAAEHRCRDLAREHDCAEGAHRSRLAADLATAEAESSATRARMEHALAGYLDADAIMDRISTIHPGMMPPDEWRLLMAISRTTKGAPDAR